MPQIHLPLVLHDRHPLAAIDGRTFLVDTGCPFTFGQGGPLRLLGESVEILGPGGRLGFNLAAVRRLAGPVDGLLGMDLLGRHRWDFDLEEERLTVATEPGPETAERLPIALAPMGGPPLLLGSHRGRPTRILFDTGAAILGYRIGGPPAGLQPVGEGSDFNPFLGEFRTPIWEDRVELGGHSLPVRFGQLPAMGEFTLRRLGVEWVLGHDLLRGLHLELDAPAGCLRILP